MIVKTSCSLIPSNSSHFLPVNSSIACSFGTDRLVTNEIAVPSLPALLSYAIHITPYRAVRPTR